VVRLTKIIIDWDYPFVGKRESLKRVKKYLKHFFAHYVPMKSAATDEHKVWIEIYGELEKLTGEKFIYGIRPPSELAWFTFMSKFHNEHDCRQHLHMWHAEDRAKLLADHDIKKEDEHTVWWYPPISEKHFIVPEEDIDMDFKLKSEKDITRDIVVFHPDHREASLLKLLRFLNDNKK